MPQVRLRKCDEHEACQLESVDGGDWQHTPRSRPLVERFPNATPELRQRIEELAAQMAELDATRKSLEEAGERASKAAAWLEPQAETVDALKRGVAESLDHLGKSLTQAEDTLRRVENATTRLAEGGDEASKLMHLLAPRQEVLDSLEGQLGRALGHVGELANRLQERTGQVDALYGKFEAANAQLGEIQALYNSLEKVEKARLETAALINRRLDVMTKVIQEESDKRMATMSKFKRRLEILGNRLDGMR